MAAFGFTGAVNETLNATMAGLVVRAYESAVSYMDFNVGRALGALKAVGLWEESIVVVWGDHGFKLGQHGAWCKHSCFVDDTNTYGWKGP